MSNGLNLKVFGQQYDNIKGIRVPGFGEDAPIYDFIVPTGIINITQNTGDPLDITQYAQANVDVLPESISLEDRVVTPTFEEQIIEPTSGNSGLSSVTVKAIKVGNAGVPMAITATPNNHTMIITPKVTNSTGYIIGDTLEGPTIAVSAADLTSGTTTIAMNGSYNVSNYTTARITVKTDVQSKTATYTPTTNSQSYHIIHDSDYIGLQFVDVNIEAIPSEYIIPSGIKNINTNGSYNIAAYETVSVSVTGGTTVVLQDKTITPSQQSVVVTCDNGYTGLGTVTVMAIPSQYIIPTGTITISSNGIYNVTNTASVEVDVADSSVDNTLVITLYWNDSTEKWEPDYTYSEISAAYGAGKTITVQVDADPSSARADGYYSNSDNELVYWVSRFVDNGLAQIIEQEYWLNSSELILADTYIYTADNGSITPHYQSKTVTPTTITAVITADNGYDALQTVTVEAIPSQYIIPTGSITISSNGTGIDVKNYATVNVSVAGSSINYPDGDILLYGEPLSSIVGIAKVGNAYVGTEE